MQSVAEVETQVGTSSKSSFRKAGATSSGAEASRTRCARLFFDFNPVHGPGIFLMEPVRDLARERPATPFGRVQLDPLGLLLDLASHVADRGGQLGE